HELEPLLRELRVEVRRLGELAQPRDLLLLARGIRGRHVVRGLELADLLRGAEALGEQIDERGVDVVDASAQAQQCGVRVLCSGGGRHPPSLPMPRPPTPRDQPCRKSGARFSRNAAMPSFWSSPAKSPANRCVSSVRPSCSGTSCAAASAALAAYSDGSDFDAIVSAVWAASSSSASAGTTRETSPDRSASSAPICRPVSTSSAALYAPTARASRCVPP